MGIAEPTTMTAVTMTNNEPQRQIPPPSRFSKMQKTYIVTTGIIMVFNGVLSSSLPGGATKETASYFGIDNPQELELPISCFLIGNVVGPIIWSPLCETYGRKPILVLTFAGLLIFTLSAALSPTFAALVIFRLLCGVFGSAPQAVVGGLFADIFPDAKNRGRAIAGYMAACTMGPALGPVVSGYMSAALGWRWTYWVALMLGGASAPLLIFLPETYAPVLDKRDKDSEKSAPTNTTEVTTNPSFRDVVTQILTRVLRMLLFESIVLFSCLYQSFIYSIFFLFVSAFPLVFGTVYGFSAGEAGLAFVPIGVGSMLSFPVYLAWDHVYQKARLAKKPWVEVEENRRLPLALLGGPLFSASLFWLAWTARPSIHWAVPVMAGIPFGFGYMLIFMALINYLADAYTVFTASALAAAGCSRTFMAALLPFAADPMYENLGVAWATSLLAFISLPMIAIPFAFMRFGDYLRRHSKFNRALVEASAAEGSTEEETETKT